MEFEPYWLARYEANQKCLQAILSIQQRDIDLETAADSEEQDKHAYLSEDFVYKLVTESEPAWVSKAREKQHLRRDCSRKQRKAPSMGALFLQLLTLSSMLGALPVLDKRETHAPATEYWATHRLSLIHI